MWKRAFAQAFAVIAVAIPPVAWAASGDGAAHAPAQDGSGPPAAISPGGLGFNPSGCKYLDRIRKQLAMTKAESELFDRQGFVVINQARSYNFGTAYRHIYGRDLPVLITSDSLLHVMHRSFDNMLIEIEEKVLFDMLSQIVGAAHHELGSRKIAADDPWAENYGDVDLYLTVARRLLGDLAPSHREQDETVRKIAGQIEGLHLQDPLFGEGTPLFGGRRPIDYSQFKPRGHYTRTARLQSYFRAMMWLGRPDCGWNILPAHPESGIHNQDARERRDAVLLVDLLTAGGQMPRLRVFDRTLEMLVGQSDNLRPGDLRKMLDDGKVASPTDFSPQAEAKLREAVAQSPASRQRVRGQVVFGGKFAGDQIPPPAVFQLLGQRFAVDAYVMAQVVYDTMPNRDSAGRLRTMPRGLDVMAALGNGDAWRLLEGDLARWQYRPHLQAARDFTAAYMKDPANEKSLYNLWLAALVALQAEPGGPNFPQAMRTEAWRRKQLHAQLGSWAELCHDARILYVKQSYSSRVECEYPAGYVEPYSEFYARLKTLAERTAQGLGEIRADYRREGLAASESQQFENCTRQAGAFWLEFARTMDTLARLARKELAAEPFSADEQRFLKETVSLTRHDLSGCDVGPWEEIYSGWYCRLLYPDVKSIEKFEPTVADVHTDPNSREVLQVGVGHTNFALVAVDNGEDRMVYVGPVYSYYEFSQPAERRLTDAEFRARLARGQEPPRPEWTRAFEPGPVPRGPRVP
ncbi:MAG: DUF3160 domain-containing protein [Thermoguttaceae bacterium]|jgi:hypothetical protein